MKILEDPDISLIEQKSTNNTQTLNITENNSQIDLKIDAADKRKEFLSQLSQYCVAKQAASKFQVSSRFLNHRLSYCS